jgi:hypothetical protein
MRAVGPYRTEMPWHTALTVLTVARLSRLKDFQYPAGVRARRSRPEKAARCMFLARVCVSTVSIVCARDGHVAQASKLLSIPANRV